MIPLLAARRLPALRIGHQVTPLLAARRLSALRIGHQMTPLLATRHPSILRMGFVTATTTRKGHWRCSKCKTQKGSKNQ